MTDRKLFNILYIVITICLLLFILSILISIQVLFTISAILIIISILILFLLFVHVSKTTNILINRLSDKVEDYIKNYEYDEAILFLENNKENTFYSSVIVNCEINLVLINLIIDNIDKVIELIKASNDKEFIDNTLYYRMLLFLDNNNVEEAKLTQRSLYKLKDPIYDVQKANSIKLLTIVDTKEQLPHQQIKSNFPIVNRIIDKYKK